MIWLNLKLQLSILGIQRCKCRRHYPSGDNFRVQEYNRVLLRFSAPPRIPQLYFLFNRRRQDPRQPAEPLPNVGKQRQVPHAPPLRHPTCAIYRRGVPVTGWVRRRNRGRRLTKRVTRNRATTTWAGPARFGAFSPTLWLKRSSGGANSPRRRAERITRYAQRYDVQCAQVLNVGAAQVLLRLQENVRHRRQLYETPTHDTLQAQTAFLPCVPPRFLPAVRPQKTYPTTAPRRTTEPVSAEMNHHKISFSHRSTLLLGSYGTFKKEWRH